MRKKLLFGGLAALVALTALAGFLLLGRFARPQPRPLVESPYQGVTYTRSVTRTPRPMVIHLVRVDLSAPGIRLLVTPGNPLPARTTSEFARDFGVQLAINGDGFTPWYDNGIWDYAPHSGEPVTPIGFAASNGEVYASDTDAEPTLYFGPNNQASFETPIGKVYNALSGNLLLVKNGNPLANLGESPAPRSAIGLDKKGKTLILVVVDGRQPGYSEGITLNELAALLTANGAHTAMNLDGGGSSTLVMHGTLGLRVLNAPIHNGIPGRERPVGNHLGVYAQP
ncbi:MAG: hypothetical protein OHK0052_23390 [Anaerolineales bacterium]